MDIASAKMIGAGIAAIGMIGAGIGLGTIFGNYVSAIARNPSARPEMLTASMIGMAFTEAIALFAVFIALLILYG